MYWKDENKEKRGREWPIFLKKEICSDFQFESNGKPLKFFYTFLLGIEAKQQ